MPRSAKARNGATSFAQREGQFCTQIGDILHAHAQSHQSITDPQPLAVGRRHRGVGHDGRVLDQAFDPAERLGQREQLAAFQHARGLFQAALDLHADDAAVAVHLAFCQRMLRVALEAGVDHPFDRGMLFQPLGQFQRALTVRLHAQVQGLEAAHGEEGIKRAGHGADRVLQETHLLGQLLAAGHHDAADHVGMAVEVFGGGMQHQVRSEFQGPLQHGRAEGVVDHQDQAVLLGERRHLGQVDQLEHRVGRRLGPDHAGVGLERGLHRRAVVEVDEAEVQPGGTAAHPFEQAVGAAVKIVHRDHVAARIEQVQHRRCRGQAGGEGEAGAAAFQVRHAALVGHAGRVLRARVLVTLVLAGALLHVGGGGVDRRHDGAGAGIGMLAGVNGASTQSKSGVLILLHDY